MPAGNIAGKRTGKLFFPVLAMLILAPWPIAYAYDYNVAGQGTVRIEVTGPSVAPNWTVSQRTVGGVSTQYDLFYVDAANNADDILTTLYLTNCLKLAHCYRYMILNIGVYVKSNAGEWEKASGYDGQLIPDTFLTLHNGQVSFALAGRANYRVTIDGGSFYCINANAGGDSLSPQFYLTAQ